MRMFAGFHTFHSCVLQFSSVSHKVGAEDFPLFLRINRHIRYTWHPDWSGTWEGQSILHKGLIKQKLRNNYIIFAKF